MGFSPPTPQTRNQKILYAVIAAFILAALSVVLWFALFGQ
jgi:hypothetical protein